MLIRANTYYKLRNGEIVYITHIIPPLVGFPRPENPVIGIGQKSGFMTWDENGVYAKHSSYNIEKPISQKEVTNEQR